MQQTNGGWQSTDSSVDSLALGEMVTAKNLIKNFKTDLGWEVQDAEYTTWRNNVKDYCAQKSIVSKIKAGEDKWKKCLEDVPGLDGFKAGIRARLAAGKSRLDSRIIQGVIQYRVGG